ncbi:glycosyltransferase family 2 protein [Streptomyces sp. NPDC058459]|uniref:glycosyltransferase family 2 protein n=1 Tax=Streptomyces sp. NPDC058459 TaxID=3346508 RepID=UPI00366377D5
MSRRKLSISIPYKRRLDNLRLVFEGLAHQTLERDQFEVVVGAMEYEEEFFGLCREFSDRIDILAVVSSRDFDIPNARNLAMRQATGEVIVQMDADTLLPPDALRNLYDRHFSFGQNICVVGQVVGYGNNNDGDVATVESRPYGHYAETLATLSASPQWPLDPRFRVEHVIPWAFGWTGLIAVPNRLVREHSLYFDESFAGWGVDDLEWSYRLCAAGIPIVLRPDVYALHLPHSRDAAANRVTESGNYRRFLNKWPARDVELAYVFGDVDANGLFLAYQRELTSAGRGDQLVSLRGSRGGEAVVLLGARLNAEGRPADPAAARLLAGEPAEILPLTGLALPYQDKTFAQCHIMPSVASLSERYRDAVRTEAERLGKQVLLVPDAG